MGSCHETSIASAAVAIGSVIDIAAAREIDFGPSLLTREICAGECRLRQLVRGLQIERTRKRRKSHFVVHSPTPHHGQRGIQGIEGKSRRICRSRHSTTPRTARRSNRLDRVTKDTKNGAGGRLTTPRGRIERNQGVNGEQATPGGKRLDFVSADTQALPKRRNNTMARFISQIRWRSASSELAHRGECCKPRLPLVS